MESTRPTLDSLRTTEEMKELALRNMSHDAKWYFSAVAGDVKSGCINERAFQRYFIQPRVLRNVSSVDTSISLLGDDFSYPIGFSPTGLHGLAHPNAELATASAAARENCLMILSSASSQPMAEISRLEHSGPKWMQIYLYKDRSVTRRLVEIAETRGFKAVVVSVDSPVRGLWTRTMPSTFFTDHSIKLSNVPSRIGDLLDPSRVFEDLQWLRSISKLPIVVKGVLSGKDAVECAKYGASAVFVSNHGARQIRRVLPSICALEEVVEALKAAYPNVEVYVDGGLRTGSDVFTALALGARAVFVGRPVLWGLAAAGEDGVRKVVQILKSEFLSTMKLAGVKNLSEITRDMIWAEHRLCKL